MWLNGLHVNTFSQALKISSLLGDWPSEKEKDGRGGLWGQGRWTSSLWRLEVWNWLLQRPQGATEGGQSLNWDLLEGRGHLLPR